MTSPMKEPDLALAGVALLVMFGFLMWHDSPIKRSPLLDPYVQHHDPSITEDSYESWLWQDPFEHDLNSYLQRDQYLIEDLDGKAEEASHRDYWVHKKIDQKKGPESQCRYQPENKIAKKNHVTILAPLLKVPNTLENKELRTRYRYAVIAGLIESGYRPLEPNRLHFFSSRENSNSKEENSSGKKYDVRWECFYNESKHTPDKSEPDIDIVVVWMNSEIFTYTDKLTYVSKNLPKIIDENKVHIYALRNILDQKDIDKIKTFNKNNEIQFIDLNDDKALTENLTKELNGRNILGSSEVGIITEQDSENARNLASNFLEYLGNPSCHKPVMDASPPPCEIKNVFYLKGLDANQSIIDKKDKNGDYQTASKRADHRSVIDLHNPSPLPIGPSQVDYLHRLAKEIKDSHNGIDLDKRDRGIKAVGIFGSDFNDKLRILEALRAEMPEILVFTTDLDAQMLSSQHWRAARNLVVASHFNLWLDQENPKHFPKFRDSQQTSIFHHTINIFKEGVEKPEAIPPQIFEIGRNGPVHLAQEKDEKNSRHTQEQATKQLMLLGGITTFLILFLWYVLPNPYYLISWLVIGSVTIFSIAWFPAINDLGEPLSFTDGISLWPTIFIQIIATLLAFAFIYYAKRILEENLRVLDRQYFNRQYFGADPADRPFTGFWEYIFSSVKTFCSNPVFPSFSGTTGLATLVLAIFISSSSAYAFNDVYPSVVPLFICLSVLVLLTILYIGTFKKKFRSIKDWAEINPNILILNNLWREYCEHGEFLHRASRVVAIWLFFAIIETILIYLLPPWPSPCRGDTCGWVSWIGVISFVVIMILLFFILDAVRLNYFWIQKLRTKHPLLVDKTTLTLDLNALKTFLDERKNKVASLRSLEQIIDLVAERTLKVDRLIYFPMLCIMLMLFARTAYFDNQEFPLSKGITFVASISLLFFAGFMLRNEAEQLKLSVIKSAEKLGKECCFCKTEVDAVINRINKVNKGAFEPMFEQPVMRASLIILASVGIFAAKYLKLFE